MRRAAWVGIAVSLGACGGAQHAPHAARARLPESALGFRFGETIEQARARCEALPQGAWVELAAFGDAAYAVCTHGEGASATAVSVSFENPAHALDGVVQSWGAESRAALDAQLAALIEQTSALHGTPALRREHRDGVEIRWELDGGTVGIGVHGTACGNGPQWTLELGYSATAADASARSVRTPGARASG